MPPREPSPELMRHFPRLTRWTDADRDRLGILAYGPTAIADDQLEEFRHLYRLWDCAGYAFRHRNVSGRAWLAARYAIRHARRMQHAYYNGSDDYLLAWSMADNSLHEIRGQVEQYRKPAAARRARSADVAGEKAHALGVADALRQRDPSATDADLARHLARELGERSERTYRRWLATR